MNQHVVCIGAGPAGLTAALMLAREGVSVTVLEADPTYVGGISRTVEYKGFHFDIGGHRFFSKSEEIEKLWTDLLGDDLLERPRSSRIYYKNQFFSYPLKAFEALRNLGFLESTLCVLSYIKARLFPIPNPRSFEDWVTNQFGRRLFLIFFKTYTEKVWGMSCSEISADWAAQRIKGLSLGSAVWNALRAPTKQTDRSKTIKTLIDSFRYPRKGPGMMWEAATSQIRLLGGKVELGKKVRKLTRVQNEWVVETIDAEGQSTSVRSNQVISSMPLRELVAALEPQSPALPHALKLKYRDFLTVALVTYESGRFQDNWIYIHDPSVKVGRIQNFKSWSPEMVPDPAYCCYGLEYFCFEGDGLWTSPDESLIELAKHEMVQLGLAESKDFIDGCVVRQPKAYPVYDDNYTAHIEAINETLQQTCPDLFVIGRNGMHKYNNQDHAMMTGLLTAKNILSGTQKYDVWRVNQDAEYLEESSSAQEELGIRKIPKSLHYEPV